MADDYAELKAEVLARFKGRDYDPDGPIRFGWHMCHDSLVELLTAPIAGRIDWIIHYKDAHEIPVRLKSLRAVLSKLPDRYVQACVELAKANGESSKAYAKWLKTRVEWHSASALFRLTYAECQAELEAIHARECPGCPWDGSTLVFDAAAKAAGGE